MTTCYNSDGFIWNDQMLAWNFDFEMDEHGNLAVEITKPGSETALRIEINYETELAEVSKVEADIWLDEDGEPKDTCRVCDRTFTEDQWENRHGYHDRDCPRFNNEEVECTCEGGDCHEGCCPSCKGENECQ